MARPLTADERTALGAAHARWRFEAETAIRTFEFADFAAAMGFVNRVALTAEKADHHPDIDIRWNKVTLTLTTHSVQRLSDLDQSLIEAIDGWNLS